MSQIITIPEGQTVYAVNDHSSQGTTLVVASCVAEAIAILHSSGIAASLRIAGVRQVA